MYIAQKPITFGGRSFLIGEEVPADLVDPKKVPQFIKQRILAEAPDFVEPMEGTVKFTIPVHAEEGDLPLELTNEELVSVTDVLQANAEEAAVIISSIVTEGPLILIHALDSRKGVRNEAKNRAGELWPDSGNEPETGEHEPTEGI